MPQSDYWVSMLAMPLQALETTANRPQGFLLTVVRRDGWKNRQPVLGCEGLGQPSPSSTRSLDVRRGGSERPVIKCRSVDLNPLLWKHCNRRTGD